MDSDEKITIMKEFNIKKWKETLIAQEMSTSEREWYIHWMKDYNRRLHNERIRKSST